MIYVKITHGWVAQRYDSETGDCVSQEFMAEDEVYRQDEEGQAIPEAQVGELAAMEKDCPFDMVQP